MEILDHSVAVYYALMPAEVSTNLARFDGIRFGLQKDTFGYESLRDYYVAVRSEGFGDEATRRILLGSYVLSSANYAGFYQKAQKARNKMIHDVKKIRENYDAIISPTSPEVARKPGEKSDPLSVYLADIYTIPANLIGSPALSLPMGLAHGRPTGLQIMTKARDEAGMFALARGIEGII